MQPDGVVSIAAQTLPTGINRVDAELSPTAAINGVDTRVNVDVAVIDTGIDLDHPDLNVNTAGARNCSKGNSANDGNGHGTHVAGTIGALDNTIGVVGVAPGARLWPVRVLNNAGSGSFADVICGIDYVAAHAAEIEVANMSLSGSGDDRWACGTNRDAMHEAICAAVNAGVTFVVAAGNSDANAAGQVPAAYDEVITVSALADFNGLPGGGAAATCRADVDDTFADFSNWGADIDLIAPGVCILSTWKGGGYNTISGTSMASPHVAGGAALYKATHPPIRVADRGQIRTAGRRHARLEQQRRRRLHQGKAAQRRHLLTDTTSPHTSRRPACESPAGHRRTPARSGGPGLIRFQHSSVTSSLDLRPFRAAAHRQAAGWLG